jgi:tRNA G10  N-methylase Trm11
MKLTKAERLVQAARRLAAASQSKQKLPAPPAAAPRPLAPVPIVTWTGAYDDNWRGDIVEAAYSHPAKAARGLLHKIFDHLKQIGALTPGSAIVDPFGGIGTTGVVGAWRGYRVICCELEPKFVDLGRQNFALHEYKWRAMDRLLPIMVQGDSRQLRKHIQEADAVVSSTPYAETSLSGGGGIAHEMRNTYREGQNYGDDPAQLGAMKEDAGVDAVISSPPYAELGVDIKGHGIIGAGVSKDPKYGQAEYGQTAGQLGGMKEGQIDAVVSSPSYIDSVNQSDAANDTDARFKRIEQAHGTDAAKAIIKPNLNQPQVYGETSGQLGAMKEGQIDAVVASPPYAEGLGHHGTPTTGGGKAGDQVLDAMQRGYGKTEGQLENMKEEQVDAVVSSPPYAESATGAGGLNTKPPQHDGQQAGRRADSASQRTDQRYGEAEGQMAKMEQGDVDAVISSPPYEHVSPEHFSAEDGARVDQLIAEGKMIGNPRGKHATPSVEYGQSDGQLSQMTKGDVDAIVSSPPHAETLLNDDQRQAGKGEPLRWGTHDEYGTSPGQLGVLKEERGVDAVISSPPYVAPPGHDTGHPRLDATEDARREAEGSARRSGYGSADGNLAHLTEGGIDAVISSPPYTGDVNLYPPDHAQGEPAKKIGGTNKNYGQTPGQLGVLKDEDGVDAVVSSPPYEKVIGTGEGPGAPGDATRRGEGHDHEHAAQGREYGQSEGQLSAMDAGGVDAVVSSPPFGTGDSASAQSMVNRTDKSAEWVKANVGSAGTEGYGETAGQMAEMEMKTSVDAVVTSPPYAGQDVGATRRELDKYDAGHERDQRRYGDMGSGDTFWSAARDIVRECYAILKPGGHAVWIVKAFVRDRQIVDFPADWRKLCEYVGFETVTEVHAMLVKKGAYHGDVGLDGEVIVDQTERKSFFRRLAESKGSPKINYEVVYIMVKR